MVPAVFSSITGLDYAFYIYISYFIFTISKPNQACRVYMNIQRVTRHDIRTYILDINWRHKAPSGDV